MADANLARMWRSAVVAVALLACSKSEQAPQPTPAAQAPAKTIDPQRARDLIAKGAVVVDVRTPGEFADGHLASATNIPVQDFATRIAEVDKLVAGDRTRPVVVYCAAGKRAAKAKAQLDAGGYTQVVNGGGYDDLR